MFLSAPAANAGRKLPSGKGPCRQASQCRRGVCLELNGRSYCSQPCGRCPAGMYCDENLFRTFGLNICVKGRAGRPVQPKALPRLPCRTDAECQGALVCAQRMGLRECTLECGSNEDCRLPEVSGVGFDFYECAFDEGRRGRRACLPRARCLNHPTSCIGAGTGSTAPAGPPAGWTDGRPVTGGGDDMPPFRAAMGRRRFAALLRQLEDADFTSERKAVLASAAGGYYFTCEQLGRILDVMEFSSERMDAIKIVAPRLVDPQNSFQVLGHLEFESEKQQARRILAR